MPLVPEPQLDDLARMLDRQRGMRVARIPVDFDPFDFARTGAALVDRAVAYSMPNGDRLVGLGTAWSTAASGADRFRALRDAISALDQPGLTAFLGYAFLAEPDPGDLWRDFRNAEAFVPRIGIQRRGGRSTLTIVIPEGEEPHPTLELLGSMRRPDPIPVVDFGDHAIESLPPVAAWVGFVADAVKVIRAGDLDKVVLARSVRVESSEPVAILRVFRQLVASYGQCYTFAWKSGDSVLMGASPELLAEVDHGAFRSNPLAGSARRGEGEDEDAEIGMTLMSSAKDRSEHSLVVDDMRMRLENLVDGLTIPAAPSLKKMATVQHLSTEITARAPEGVTVLDAVDALHPTPAVAGVPREASIDYIAANEQLERGWYSGGVGWMSPDGDGVVAIALRCGLIQHATTRLFAGAGIVADSEPATELQETRLKLRPLLDLVAST
jgi:menaquinone-specific isochorismate synthase